MTRHAIAFFAFWTLGVALLVAPAYAHDAKDPVCRMIVDSDTTKFRHKLGNKTFYFCSKQCLDSFKANPVKYEKLAAQLEKENPREYEVTLETNPAQPTAKQPVELTFAIRYADNRELVREYEVIHEKLFHLIMVTEDLAWFEHQHPVRSEDGLFRLIWKFPRPGRYTLYADFTPADGDNQVKPVPLVVGGGPGKNFPLKPDVKRVKQVGDYRIELRLKPDSLRMEQATLLTYIIHDRQGRPIRNMQPFIGVMGHLFAISEDGKEVVHTHSLFANTYGNHAAMQHDGLRVTPEMATEKGPAFSFKLTLPTSGLYKTWAQFMHNNRVITVPFTFRVAGIWEKPTSSVKMRGLTCRKGDMGATCVLAPGIAKRRAAP